LCAWRPRPWQLRPRVGHLKWLIAARDQRGAVLLFPWRRAWCTGVRTAAACGLYHHQRLVAAACGLTAAVRRGIMFRYGLELFPAWRLAGGLGACSSPVAVARIDAPLRHGIRGDPGCGRLWRSAWGAEPGSTQLPSGRARPRHPEWCLAGAGSVGLATLARAAFALGGRRDRASTAYPARGWDGYNLRGGEDAC